MEAVEFRDVEVLDETLTGLRCRIGVQQVTIPSLLLQPGTTIRRPRDHGPLFMPRWLGIGLGLVGPFPEQAQPGRDPGNERRKRRAPRRALRRDRATGQVASEGWRDDVDARQGSDRGKGDPGCEQTCVAHATAG